MAAGGNLMILKLLTESGAHINSGNVHGITPLHVACLEKNIEVVKHLISSGADKEKPDINGITPLYFACGQGNWS